MILAKLVNYYHRLANETDKISGSLKVPSYGFSEEKISYILVLNEQGELVDYQTNLTDDKKPQPKLVSVPKVGGSSSNSIKPDFLWGNSQYVLGITNKVTKNSDRTQKMFEAFKNYHLQNLKDVKDDGLKALYLFLSNWKDGDFSNSILYKEKDIIDKNIVFKLDGVSGFIHQSQAAKDLWYQLCDADELEMGICLVTGNKSRIAYKHPVIKDIFGGERAGNLLISFNKESFKSYGKEKGNNAPVSEQSAFAYTTALNYLLRRENNHCLMIGDTSTVFWAEADSVEQAEFAEDIFAAVMNPPDDEQEASKIFNILEQISAGRPLKEIAPQLAENTRFYILGLAPNASRISIRFWLDTTFGELAHHLANHWQDLAMEPCAWKTPPSIWRLIGETAVKFKRKDGNGYELPKLENVSPVLAGEMTRAILNDTPYPMSLLSQLITRLRADGDINGIRIAMIKAVLQRKFRKGLITEGVPMSLNLESENTAYLMGRLFAVLERIQSQALGELNAGIADRYYGSASSVPYSVFPRLLSGAKHHLSRLRKDKAGMAVILDKDLGDIIFRLPETFPRHFSIDEQGRFAIGYYHQKQSYFAKKAMIDNPVEE